MDDFFDDCDGMEEAWNDGPEFEEEPTESDDNQWNGPDWDDWMIIGPMSEEIVRKKRWYKRKRNSPI